MEAENKPWLDDSPDTDAENIVSPSPAIDNPHPHGTPEHYLWELHRVETSLRMGTISPLKAKQEMEVWHKFAESYGIDLKAAAENALDPIRKLFAATDLVDHNADTLLQIRESIEEAATIGAAELDVKKKWLKLIDETMELQARAKNNPVYCTIYVVRCQQTNKVLRMKPIHISFFKTWNDPTANNSLILAPPGVGKTTCLYGQDIWDMVRDTKLRFMRMGGTLDNAQDRLGVVRTYITTRRLRALFPNVQIDNRQCVKNNASEFTLIRENIGSQEPTMFAAGWSSDIQGSGLDRLNFDDICGIRVQNEASTRRKIDSNFRAVAMKRRRNFLTSKIRYIATPWHMDDTTCRLMKDIRAGRLKGWIVHLCPVQEDSLGNPLPLVDAPGWAQDALETKLNNPGDYACCYKLDPRHESIRKLKGLVYYDVSGGTDKNCPSEWRDYYKRLLTAIKGGERWQVLDPAFGGRDHVGMVGFSLSPRGTAAFTNASFFNDSPTTLLDKLCDIVVSNSADKILIESQGPQKGAINAWTMYLTAKFGNDYESKILTSGTRYRNEQGREVGQNIQKGRRYYNSIPYLEDGRVMFPGQWEIDANGKARLGCVNEPNLMILHEQLLNYPSVTQDAGIDCFSMFINYNVGSLASSIQSLRRPPTTDDEKTEMRINVLAQIHREQMAQRNNPRQTGVRVEEAELFAA